MHWITKAAIHQRQNAYYLRQHTFYTTTRYEISGLYAFDRRAKVAVAAIIFIRLYVIGNLMLSLPLLCIENKNYF
jgi:hypothetical protein